MLHLFLVAWPVLVESWSSCHGGAVANSWKKVASPVGHDHESFIVPRSRQSLTKLDSSRQPEQSSPTTSLTKLSVSLSTEYTEDIMEDQSKVDGALEGEGLTMTNHEIAGEAIASGEDQKLLVLADETLASASVLVPDLESSQATVAVDSSKKDVLSIWKRRLITHEDPFSIHKWSSIVYTLTSVAILGTGGVRFLGDMLDGTSYFATIPDSLISRTYAFVISNAVMCVASVRMSFIHRQGDLAARNAFLGVAASSLFSGFFFLFTSPFGPEALNNDLVNQGSFAILVLLNVAFIMDTIIQIPEIVEGRRDRKADDINDPMTFSRDVLGYVLPIAWGLPMVLATGYQASYLHDRPWLFEFFSNVQESTGIPFLASVWYSQVLTSMAASFGALFVTLRDKKLISKPQELAGITVFSVSTMIWAIYNTVVFYQNIHLAP